jgi:hypothetical protein
MSAPVFWLSFLFIILLVGQAGNPENHEGGNVLFLAEP